MAAAKVHRKILLGEHQGREIGWRIVCEPIPDSTFIMQPRSLIHSAVALLTFALAFTACDKLSSPGGTSPAPVAKTPGETVQAFYKALNEGKYSEAQTMLTKEAFAALKASSEKTEGGLKELANAATKNGTISAVEVAGEEIQGDKATVVVHLRFKDGTAEENTKNGLHKVDGAWLLTGGE